MTKILLLLTMAIGLTCLSFNLKTDYDQAKKPWVVPDNFKNMKNPVASDAQSIAEGKSLYTTHCKSCHGSKGMGDGTKAAQLKTEPGDFSKADFLSQTDGSIFYKTTEGRDEMPGFKKKIPDADDRWSIINYIRTFKK
jgi:mono/diheme cytochrome c family protein